MRDLQKPTQSFKMPTRSELLTPQPGDKSWQDKRSLQADKLRSFQNIIDKRILKVDSNQKPTLSDVDQKQGKNSEG